ncbi:MAG: insulinase family protein [Thermoflexales bacterium]|nr:insulinase family protein [Thermoflexales bacterium]MDW8350693.1 pitrilysin family protein [Anaerolineae bacterium]
MHKSSKSGRRRVALGARSPSLPHSGNIACFALANGIHLYVYENLASSSVVIDGYLDVGALDEPDAARAGLAGFVADCITRGTQRYTYLQIYEQIESAGASLNISGGMFTTSFFAKSLAEDLPLMLDLLSEVIRCPTFPPSEVEKERAEWLTDLHERANDAQAMCSLAFNEMCYPEGHPYHYSTDGYLETAQAITLDDVRRFHATFYAPAGMVIVVVGAVRAEHVHHLIEARFADWMTVRPTRNVNLDVPPLDGRCCCHVHIPGKRQTAMLLGGPGPSQLDPHWLTYALMNSIFGQFGMYGRLGQRARKDQGLVYYIGSRFEGGLGPGPWNVYAGTDPNAVDRVVEIVRAEMHRMRERKVRPAELDDNKAYFVGSLPLQMETNEGIAGQILNMVRFRRGLDWLLEYPEHVYAITAADIQAAAQRWLDPERYVLATAGPTADDGK